MDNKNFYINYVTENPDNTKKPTKKVKFVLIFVLSAALLIFGVFLSLHLYRTNSPEYLFDTCLSEIKNSFNITSSLNEKLNLSGIIKGTLDGDVNSSFDFTIDNLEGDALPSYSYLIKSAGLKVDSSFDTHSRKALSKFEIYYGGIPFADSTLSIDESVTSLSVPYLYEGSLFIDTGSLSKDYANSYLQSLSGIELPDVSYSVFDYTDAFFARVSDILSGMGTDTLSAKAIYEKGDSKLLLTPDGKKGCNSYIMKFEGEDLMLTLFTYKKHPLSLSVSDIIEEGGERLGITLDLNFVGDINVTDDIKGQLTLSLLGVSSSLNFEIVTKLSDDTEIEKEISFALSGDVIKGNADITYYPSDISLITSLDIESTLTSPIGINSVILFENIEKGSKFTINITDLYLNLKDSFLCRGNGSFSLDTSAEPVIPEYESSRNLVTMTKEDYDLLFQEILKNLTQGPLSSLISEFIL